MWQKWELCDSHVTLSCDWQWNLVMWQPCDLACDHYVNAFNARPPHITHGILHCIHTVHIYEQWSQYWCVCTIHCQMTPHMYLGWSYSHTVPQTVGGQGTLTTTSSLPLGTAHSGLSADKTFVRTGGERSRCQTVCTSWGVQLAACLLPYVQQLTTHLALKEPTMQHNSCLYSAFTYNDPLQVNPYKLDL